MVHLWTKTTPPLPSRERQQVGGRQRKAFRINVGFDLASRKKRRNANVFSATGMARSGISSLESTDYDLTDFLTLSNISRICQGLVAGVYTKTRGYRTLVEARLH
jgi:hypothetical protein